MDSKLIYGIQQIGVGVENAEEAFRWYATRLGSDVIVFDDSNEATYMAPYMGGKSRNKRALMAVNMRGGSGYEIWQYLDRKPTKIAEEIKVGDFGIAIIKIKTRNAQISYDRLKSKGVNILSDIRREPDGRNSFYIKDPYNNILCIKEFDSWYTSNGFDLGGIFSCVIGVSDIEKSLGLYADVLGYDDILYDETGVFDDLAVLPNGNGKFRRVLLGHTEIRTGGFSKLFGESQIELIQSLDATPKAIFKDRYWGDLGFIHICFDIKNMKKLVTECKEKGYPFKVLSDESFDMGDANGHWGYIEDNDGTLIEFVETHKVPILKKLNWYIKLKNRDPKRPLPNWIIKALSLKKVRIRD
jgi:catechol 2,3-dioxygenase-like lactoylglutathione lyase family enzyme